MQTIFLTNTRSFTKFINNLL